MTAGRARARAVRMLAALAAVLLLAGVLPWVTGGETIVRLMGLPLFLAGLMVLGVTLRVWHAGRRPAASAPPVERGCDGCVCGLDGGCAASAARAGDAAGSAPPAG